MRRLGQLFDEVASARNLWRAWRDFRRGKRRRPSVAEFEVDADQHVFALHREVAAGSYLPGAYRLFLIREPKARLIAAAPVRDRVVHHAIHRVLAPRLDRSLVETTFACLPGRGSHRALLAFLAALRAHRFVLCLDVRRYFPSIDRGILKALLARKLKDPPLLDLLGRVMDAGDGIYRTPGVAAALGFPPGFPPAGSGLPIGNLTSQWWANLYLSGLDHYAKRELKLPHAQRYMDDVTLFADDRGQLEAARAAIAGWLARERRLELKDPKAPVRAATERFRYLGHRVSRAGMDPLPQSLTRMRRRLRGLVLEGRTATLARSIASYRGLLGIAGARRMIDSE